MRGGDGAIRPAYAELAGWLDGMSPEVLLHRRREAELLFRRIGITFAVHGEVEAQERLIPFDVIPRILSGAEWSTLARGLEQRVRALNLFLKDVYSQREILRAGIVPVMAIAQSVSAQPGPNAATTRPADAAPVICPVFIASLLIELPSWRSESGTICGSSACEAG